MHAPYLLPPNAFRSLDSSQSIPNECLFSEEIVVNALNAFNYDTSRFNRVLHISTG